MNRRAFSFLIEPEPSRSERSNLYQSQEINQEQARNSGRLRGIFMVPAG